MPKTRFDKPRFPPVNRLRAMILERKFVSGMGWDDIASAANVSSGTLRGLMHKDPWDWPRDIRTAVCRFLDIKLVQSVEESWEEE